MIEIKQAIEILASRSMCITKYSKEQCSYCDCYNCEFSKNQGTAEQYADAISMAMESLQMINEDDLLNQFKLYTHIYKLMFNVTNVNFLKLISATANELINDIEEKEKLRVDDTEQYKFDDTMRYDE